MKLTEVLEFGQILDYGVAHIIIGLQIANESLAYEFRLEKLRQGLSYLRLPSNESLFMIDYINLHIQVLEKIELGFKSV